MTDLADVARDLAGAGDPRRWLSELTIEAACGWRAAFSNQEESCNALEVNRRMEHLLPLNPNTVAAD